MSAESECGSSMFRREVVGVVRYDFGRFCGRFIKAPFAGVVKDSGIGR